MNSSAVHWILATVIAVVTLLALSAERSAQAQDPAAPVAASSPPAPPKPAVAPAASPQERA